jgi:tetratricopeptide (TPR) repeat protein
MDAEGVDKAVAHYRELRENAAIRGAFDFGEWEVNTLAERLEKEGRVNDAIAIYEMNREFYPRSLAIVSTLGRLYETASDTTAAIRLYERLLELNPESPRAKERLNALKK